MKITCYNRKHLSAIKKQYRGSDGRFASRFKKASIYLLAILAVLTITYLSQRKPEIQIVDKVVVINDTQEIIEKEKASILNDLEQCESSGNENAIVWVDGGRGKNAGSFGAYQFKVGTIQHFVKDLTDFQALALASNKSESRKLAEYIIFETEGGIYNWKNCMVKKNLLSRVNFVKQLSSKTK
jgi:hypothetical protein